MLPSRCLLLARVVVAVMRSTLPGKASLRGTVDSRGVAPPTGLQREGQGGRGGGREARGGGE